jgi:hypothetical protein
MRQISVSETLESLARHLHGEHYGSAVQLVNDLLGEDQFQRVTAVADLLDKWTAGDEKTLSEHAFCFRSVFRSVLFEDLLRRAIANFSDPRTLPTRAVAMGSKREPENALVLRLVAMEASELDDWLKQRWRFTRQVTELWAAPSHDRHACPVLDRN